MRNSLKERIFPRILNRLMNTFHIYPYFKLKGYLKGQFAKIYNSNYIWRPPEVHVAKIMNEKISQGETVLDIGAHFGYYSLFVAKKVGPLGKVICFEPSKETRRILIKNILKNNYQKRVKIEKKGISNKKEILNFGTKKFSPMNSFLENNLSEKNEIECTDLDSYCKENSITPNFIKIDAEGMGEKAIFGMKQILKNSCPKIILEIDKDEGDLGELFKLFKKNKYKIYTWTTRIDEDYWSNLKEIQNPEEMITKETYFEK